MDVTVFASYYEPWGIHPARIGRPLRPDDHHDPLAGSGSGSTSTASTWAWRSSAATTTTTRRSRRRSPTFKLRFHALDSLCLGVRVSAYDLRCGALGSTIRGLRAAYFEELSIVQEYSVTNAPKARRRRRPDRTRSISYASLSSSETQLEPHDGRHDPAQAPTTRLEELSAYSGSPESRPPPVRKHRPATLGRIRNFFIRSLSSTKLSVERMKGTQRLRRGLPRAAPRANLPPHPPYHPTFFSLSSNFYSLKHAVGSRSSRL